MAKPYRTAAMPVGTVIVHDGERVTKTRKSSQDPFPWVSEYGTEYGDEWAAHRLDEGATLIEGE